MTRPPVCRRAAARAHRDRQPHRRGVDPAGCPPLADETLLVMLHGLLCWLAGRRVPLLRVEWAHPAPPMRMSNRRMFSPELRFDRPATAIVSDAVLQVPVTLSEGSPKAFFARCATVGVFKQVASGLG